MWKINRQANSSVITPVSYQEWNGDNRSSWMAFLHRNKVSFCCWSLVHVPKQIIHPVLVYFLELYSSCQFILQLLVWNLNFNLGWVPDRRMADCLGDRLSILFIYPVGLFQRQSQVKMFTLNASEYLRYQQVNLWQPQPLDGHMIILSGFFLAKDLGGGLHMTCNRGKCVSDSLFDGCYWITYVHVDEFYRSCRWLITRERRLII